MYQIAIMSRSCITLRTTNSVKFCRRAACVTLKIIDRLSLRILNIIILIETSIVLNIPGGLDSKAHQTKIIKCSQETGTSKYDLRVPVGSLSWFKLSLPQCNVPGVLNCMSGRLSGFPSLYWRYLCISYENYKYWVLTDRKVNPSSNIQQKVSGKFMLPPS